MCLCLCLRVRKEKEDFSEKVEGSYRSGVMLISIVTVLNGRNERCQ